MISKKADLTIFYTNLASLSTKARQNVKIIILR